jgi:ribosomal protein S18 acetylase RimI-like enzyme
VNIRPLIEPDIPALAALMAGDPLWQRYGVTEASATWRLREGLAEGATIAVAEVGDRPAGFVWYVERGAFARSGYIMLIGVQPGLRGRGIGAALMAHAEAAMCASAADVFLLVSDFNAAGQRFYERLGYVQVGALPDYVASGVTELIYRKHRPAASSSIAQTFSGGTSSWMLWTAPNT